MGRLHRSVAVGIAIVLLMSGCPARDPLQTVAGAHDALREAGGARVEISSQLSGGDLAEPVELSLTGQIDLGRMLSRLEGRVRGSTSATRPTQVSVDTVHTQPPWTAPAWLAVQAGDEFAVEIVTDPASLYMRSELFARMLPRGADWLEIDLQGAVAEQTVPTVDLLHYWHPNPAREVALLSGAETVERVDEDEFRGDTVTNYRVDVDITQAIDSSDGRERSLLERFSELLPEDALRMRVSLDAEGRLRRMSRTVEFELADGAGRFTHEQTLELFDFDSAVEIAPPPGSETADLAGMLRGWGSVDPLDAFVDMPGYDWGPLSEQIAQQVLDEMPEEDHRFLMDVIARELLADGEPIALAIVMQAVPAVAASPEFRRNLLAGLADDCGDVQELASTPAEDYICQAEDVTAIVWFDQSLVTTILGPDRHQLEAIAGEMHGPR